MKTSEDNASKYVLFICVDGLHSVQLLVLHFNYCSFYSDNFLKNNADFVNWVLYTIAKWEKKAD